MIDQETGVRGYVTTNDLTFLEPYTQGRNHYLALTQDLESRARQADPELGDTALALRQAEDRATEWYNNVAQNQVSRMQAGADQVAIARSTEIARYNKARFDAFRLTIDNLNQKATSELDTLQKRTDQINLFILGITLVLASLAVLLIWISFTRFITVLRRQLQGLMIVTSELKEGNLAVRVVEPTGDELGMLGSNFNTMATALEQQQLALKQRDIQDSLLLLNTTLNQSLELEALLDGFLGQLLKQLAVEVGTVYLYSTQTNLLTIAAVQGFERQSLQPMFALGEDLLGRAAATRQPLTFNQPSDQQVNGFRVKTVFGQVLPATLYYLPIVRGAELLGVMMVGSFQPMTENTRNVLNVITSNLAVAISNAQAFRHIQSQSEEIDRRRHELERNNTELSQQRDELTVLNTALEEANRLRSQFLSTMSHELRTPLTAIIGFSQLVLRGSEADNFTTKQRNNIERILKNGQHLLGLVNDVLDIAKIEAGRMDVSRSEIAVQPFVTSVLDQTQALAIQKGLVLQAEIEPGVTNLETDAEKLRQILLNLVSNAIKFTEKGSVKVQVRLKSPTEPGKQGIAQEQVIFLVEDTGIGIAPAQQARIFEEFYQADSTSTRKYGGTGLGLSIVQKLTDLLSGTVELFSVPNQGSTFTVTLPRRARNLPSEQPMPRLQTEPLPTRLPVLPAASEIIIPSFELNRSTVYLNTDKRLVLAVDDDADVVDLIQSSLENTIYQVVGLSDPSQVLLKVEELKPYAVTLDVMMPGSNGWQILQQLKSNPNTAPIPVIMLTIISDRSAGYVLGANDYLVKPIDPDVLIATLNRFMARQTPLLVASQAESGTTQEPGNDGRSRGIRPGYVLAVDDELDIRSVLEQTLSEGGFEVKTAAGGLEALQLVVKEPPAVILLDLMMPDLDGFEVLNQLKANPATASIPVVILTAKTLTSEDYERLRWGASRIIQKGSLPLGMLLEEVASLLQRFQTPGRT